MLKTINTKKILFTFFIILIIVVYVLFHLIIIPNTSRIMLIAHAIFLIGPLLMVIESYAVTKLYGKNNIHGKAFYLIFLGSISMLIANIITVYVKYIIISPVYPSLADYFYVLGYPFLAIGLFKEVSNAQLIKLNLFKKIFIFIFAIIMVVLFTKIFYKSTNTTEQNVLNIFYRSVEFFIMLAIIFVMRLTAEYKNGRLFIPWLFISIGGLCFIVVGILYNFYFKEFKAYLFPYSLLNSLWLSGYLLISYGMFNMKEEVSEIKTTIRAKMYLKNII